MTQNFAGNMAQTHPWTTVENLENLRQTWITNTETRYVSKIQDVRKIF